MAAALAYDGYPYLLGAKGPHRFDCSGLAYQAMADVGLRFPVGTSLTQIDACTPIPVQQALTTPGALLWLSGHDGISIGDGTTIEARNPTLGVGVNSANFNTSRFTRGGLLPGVEYAIPPPEATVATSPAKGYISSSFGNRPIYGYHAGVDIAGSGPVYAPVDITVVRVVRGRKPGQASTSGAVLASGRSGNGLVGKTSTGSHLLFGHVAVPASIKAGQKLSLGTYLGGRDLSGITSGYHMHFETWRTASAASYYDPQSWAKANKVSLGAEPTRGSAPAPTPPPEDIMTPAQEAKLDRVLALLDKIPAEVWAAQFGADDARRSAGDILVGLPREVAEATLNAQFGKGESRRSVVQSLSRIEAATRKG